MQQWIPASLALLALAAPQGAAAEGAGAAAGPAREASPVTEKPTVAADDSEAAADEEATAPDEAASAPPRPWPIPEVAPTDAEAQFVIGRALLLGHDENGKPHRELRQPRAANEWFEKAAKQGHAKAQVNLGISYLRGRGGRYGPEKGLEWIRKASDQGHPKAHLELALMYRDGRVVRRDRVRALMYIVLAAQRGSPAAQFMQSGFARRLSQKDRQEALRLVRAWRVEHGYPATGPLRPTAAAEEPIEPTDGDGGDGAKAPSAGATDAAAGDAARPTS